MKESIQTLAEVVSKVIIKALQASPFFSLCIDETTEVSVTKHLILYCRYIAEGDIKTSLLHIAALSIMV